MVQTTCRHDGGIDRSLGALHQGLDRTGEVSCSSSMNRANTKQWGKIGHIDECTAGQHEACLVSDTCFDADTASLIRGLGRGLVSGLRGWELRRECGHRNWGGFSKTYLWQVVWAHSGLKWGVEVVDCIDWTGLLGRGAQFVVAGSVSGLFTSTSFSRARDG